MNSNKKKLLERIQNQFGQIPDEDPEFESIVKPWKYCMDHDEPGTIDDLTWDDLDMNQVFARLDSCMSSLGEEYLYIVLHKLGNEPDIEKREKLMEYLEQNPELRVKLQYCLSKVGKSNYNGLIQFLNEADDAELSFTWIYRVLAFLPLVFAVLIPFNYMLGIICMLVAFGVNILVSFYARKKIEMQLPAIRYFNSVLSCCKKICKIQDDGINDSKKNIRKGLSILRGIGSASTGSTPNRYYANDSQVLAEYFNMITLHDIRCYNKLVRIVDKNEEACLALCRELAELDVAIAVLSFRKSLPFYSKPHFIKGMQLNLQDIYHPLLQNPIPNSVVLSANTLITGSNASGKSTFIKAIAINGILAVSLNTCTARVYQAPKVPVISSMAVRDNLSAGDSYFIAEIKSMKRVLDHVKREPYLCFIDEILKGTNTIERIAASTAVLKYLHEQNCLCITASHDIELTQILADEYENYHFTEQITNNEILFDYLIKPGPSKSKNAVKLLSYINFDQKIIEDAESMVKDFEQTGKWS
ncbi:MAG TPA: hypothetical protein VHP31_09720 [Caproicibacter sp.]|nr:hypothetical protein [Caproicibacter sp.]